MLHQACCRPYLTSAACKPCCGATQDVADCSCPDQGYECLLSSALVLTLHLWLITARLRSDRGAAQLAAALAGGALCGCRRTPHVAASVLARRPRRLQCPGSLPLLLLKAFKYHCQANVIHHPSLCMWHFSRRLLPLFI